MTDRFFSIIFVVTLSFSMAHAGETESISTSDILSEALSMSCVDYRPVGVCFWLRCVGPKCSIETSLKVGHYNPDLVVSAYNGIGNNPWEYASDLGGSGSGDYSIEAGSNRISQNTGSDRRHQALKFKSADVVGHPLGSLSSIPYRCPSQAQSFFPYFVSELDTTAWRYGLPEMLYPQALIPGVREVGNFPSNTWGSVYPRSGFINQTSDPKAAAVIAQRSGDIVTRTGQPHVYYSVIRDVSNSDMKTWPPGELIEGDEATGKWQMLTPIQESECAVFGEDDTTTANGWGGGKVSTGGNYAWTLWRPYSCCEVEGVFLWSIGTYP